MRIILKRSDQFINVSVESNGQSYDVGSINLSDESFSEYVIAIGESEPLTVRTKTEGGSAYEAGFDYQYTREGGE